MGRDRSRNNLSTALVRYGGLAMLVSATYPLALLGQFAVDIVFGDAEILRDLVYGYRRLLAAALVQAWADSLIWVAAFWLLAEVSTRVLPPIARAAGLVAVLAFVAVSVAKLVPVPAMFGWLLVTALVLHAAYRLACARFV
jgi:hypothetical protein